MARAGITKGQVFEAANALAEEGTTATVQALRERIGSGSYSTISTHLADWKAERAGQVPANIPDMPEKVTLAFHQVWSVAAHAAREDVETERQALEVMRREMEQDKADMSAEIERLEKEQDEATAKVDGLEAALETERHGREEAEGQSAELRIENARLDERVKAAEGRAEEFKEQLESLQAKFADAAKARERKAPQRKKQATKTAKPNEPDVT